MNNKIKKIVSMLLLFFCIATLLLGTESTKAATSDEAESDGYTWTSTYEDGTPHYMMNLPITNWKSSAPAGSTTGGTVGVDYIVQNGGFVNNPVTWKWSDISKLTMTNTNPWKQSVVNGKLYDYTNYGDGEDYLSFYKYEGTFYIDPAYDMDGMYFSIVPVSESSYLFLDDDVYVFVYPQCMKNEINDSNFMNYLVFWSGTQCIWEDSSYFHGVPGVYLNNEGTSLGDPFCTIYPTDGSPAVPQSWWCQMTNANASLKIEYGWNQVKNRSDYDGNWCMTIVFGGTANSSTSYRYLIGAEFNPNQILYDGNGATSWGKFKTKIQRQNYGQTVNILDNWYQKDGYIFTGWNTRADGSGKWYQPGTPYSSVEPLKLFAQWEKCQYTISYDGNGATGGATVSQICSVGQEYQLNQNGFTKTGYTFAGWATTPTGEVTYNDMATVKDLATTNGAVVTLYAKWTPNTYIVRFDRNDSGGISTDATVTASGTMSDITITYDQFFDFPTNGFLRENEYGSSVFLGWSIDKDAIAKTWDDCQNISVNALTDATGVTDANGAVISVYAIWDDCPWITAHDLYYTLEQAQSGFITHDELMNHASATDREDGSNILPGDDLEKGTSFKIIDYAPTDFTQFKHDGSSTETYQVIDSAGNTYKKRITVHVVDTTPIPVGMEGTTRFINEYYYYQPYENGGLEENSIWKTDPEYVAVIKEGFENSRNNTRFVAFTSPMRKFWR